MTHTPPPGTIRMADIRDELVTRGIVATFDTSGGGCATMYVGIPTRIADQWRYPLLIGTGTYRGQDSYLYAEDASIGRDDDGETDADTIFLDRDDTAQDIANRAVAFLARHYPRG